MDSNEVERFERDGFLLLPNLLSEAEIEKLRQEICRLSKKGAQSDGTGPNGTASREGSTALRQMFDFHESTGSTASQPFRALSRSSRLLGRAKKLLKDDSLYLFQSKANIKNAVDGGIFMWHQDSANWLLDGVPTSNMLTFLISLEETTELSGSLYFIPGSHRLGILEQEQSTTWRPTGVTPKKRMLQILRDFPAPVAITGKPGMGAVFHSNIVHGSSHNLSGKDRWHIYLVYNPIANKPQPVDNPRPSYKVSRNYEVLTHVSDDAVLLSQNSS